MVQATLIERAQAEGRSMAAIKAEEVHIAVVLALGEKHERQAVHLGRGRGWIKDENGKKQLLAPEHLSAEVFLQWLTRRAIEIAADRKTKRSQKREVSWELLKPADLSTEYEGDPEYLLLQQEREQEMWGVITAPRERQLVEFLLSGYTVSEAAQHMGFAPATARVLHFRLRQRLF